MHGSKNQYVWSSTTAHDVSGGPAVSAYVGLGAAFDPKTVAPPNRSAPTVASASRRRRRERIESLLSPLAETTPQNGAGWRRGATILVTRLRSHHDERPPSTHRSRHCAHGRDTHKAAATISRGMEGFGVLLRRLRLAAGLTQEALAERAGLSARAISDLERHPDRTPRLDSVASLGDALDLDAVQRAALLVAARPDSGAPTPPGGIPRPLTPLIGREDAVAELTGWLCRDGVRLLTLTGPGGVGKTRVALAVAARAAGAFAGGAMFVDLAALREPNLVLPAIATRLAIDERDAGSLPDRVAAAIGPRRLLLLADSRVPGPGDPGHEPGGPPRPRRARVPGGAAGGLAGGRPLPGARRGHGRPPGGRRPRRRRRGRDLPPPGRAAARHRAGRGAGAAAAAGGPAGPPRPAPAAADRRPARPAGAPAHDARRRRLELRPPRRGRTAPVPASLRLRRRVHAGRGGPGGRAGGRPGRGAGGQEPGQA
ncbi:MAG: XRE family transcriptional regulator [Chloroflexi bacterium]|nr:MAG: XRE family transcriptional regulator [Chloroflexota bacterium]